MLQDRLEKIKNYFKSIELVDGRYLILMKYKQSWGAYPSDDGIIQAVPDENEPNMYWYYSKDPKVGVDRILDLIEETIQTNKDALKKAELFKIKAAELQKLFSSENLSLEELQRLEFVISDAKSAPVKPKKVDVKKPRISSKKEIMKLKVTDTEEASEEKEEKPVVSPVKEKEHVSVKVMKEADHEMVDDVNQSMENSAYQGLSDGEEVVNATDMSQDEIDDLRG